MGKQEERSDAPSEAWSATEQAWMATDAESGVDEYSPEPALRRRLIVVIANSVSLFCLMGLVILGVAAWRGRPPPPAPLPAVVVTPESEPPPLPPPVVAVAEPVLELEPEIVERTKPAPVSKPRSRARAQKRVPPQTAVLRTQPKPKASVVKPVVKPAAPAPKVKARYGHF